MTDRISRRRRVRWIAAGGAAAVASLLGVALALHSAAAPACAAVASMTSGRGVAVGARPVAAPPTGGTVHRGKATYYDAQGSGGNCSFVSAPANRMYVALGPTEYARGAACGSYLDVTGPKGTVRVLVIDQCPGCERGHLDLSAEAFARIADPVQGVVPITYRAVVNPPQAGPLTFRIKEGSSQWWLGVQVGGHGNPLASVEAGSGSNLRRLTRTDYNYWLAEDGLGPGPYTFTVTDVYGNRAVVTGIRLLPGTVQKTTTRLYGTATASATATPSASPRSPLPSPVATSPTAHSSPSVTSAAQAAQAAREEPAETPHAAGNRCD
ncbi:MAG TPA: expansin EXLX1 family cellulose-binding protein [Micromonospora sp.]|mgnify:CR=1 FL=1